MSLAKQGRFAEAAATFRIAVRLAPASAMGDWAGVFERIAAELKKPFRLAERR